jgi:hypothetical protein
VRAPQHLGCNGRIVAYDSATGEAWCLCRRRWAGNQLVSEFVRAMQAMVPQITRALAQLQPAMERAAKSMRQLGRVLS